MEGLAFTLLAAAVAAWLGARPGYFGWSWDALNHHVYLGLVAEQPQRLQSDVLAASFQSYQWPYLYWPVYRLALLDGGADPAFGARLAGAWAAVQAALLMAPMWLLSWRLLPASSTARGACISAMALRAAACALGWVSVVLVTAVQTTANDLLAAVPLLWALAIMAARDSGLPHAGRAAALWGVSVAFKLSNALFLPLLLWWCCAPGMLASGRVLLQRAALVTVSAALGFGLAYAPWGVQLWRLTGNPVHPYAPSVFAAPAR